MLVDYKTYESYYFTCKNCGWKGKGTALTHGDFSEASFIGNLECPECNDLVAYWQAPLIKPDSKKEDDK